MTATHAAIRRREELARFLRARRAALTPDLVGVPTGPRRRTPGLRREEVALLAGVGVTWYTWLEQGRDIRMARETLERIANALRLTAPDKAYLFDLVDLTNESITDEVDPAIQAVLDSLELPAMVTNARLDVLAFNRLIDEIWKFDAYPGRFARNLIWRNCMDPSRRTLYVDWGNVFKVAVRFLRSQYASRVGHPNFEELITELDHSSPEFAREWRAQATESLALVSPLRINAPGLGLLKFQSTRFLLADRPGDTLFVLAPADAQTAAVLAKEWHRLAGSRRSRPPLDGSGGRRSNGDRFRPAS